MKKLYSLILVLLLLFLSACGTGDVKSDAGTDANTDIVESDAAPTAQDNTEMSHGHPYIGDYEKEPVYQKIKEIENCTDPESLCTVLEGLYGEEFSYIEMQYNAATSEYKPPYNTFFCLATALSHGTHPLEKGPLTSDTYAFFRPYNEAPSFIMDDMGTYIVSSYKIHPYGSSGHQINAWILSDLCLSLHGYIDCQEDDERLQFIQDTVRYMDYYLELENLIIDSLSGDSGSISKTESLRPNIEILSVDVTGPTMHELTVKYRINNISDKRGVVYLTCSGHSYQTELHFNDDNFKNDYRADGQFDYNMHYGKDGDDPGKLSIFYGYGDFDPYKGWDNEMMTTISLLYTEDFGEIISDTIPASEIYPLYFEGDYIGAWTTHGSGGLYEINGNSASIPFEKHNTFVSEKGDTVSVELLNGRPLFTINGIAVGEPTEISEHNGVTSYSLIHHGYFSIDRYPNDEYIRVQNAFSIIGESDIYLYP